MDRLLAQLSHALDTARTVEDLVRPLLEMSQAVTGLESACLTAVDVRSGRQRILFARNTGALRIVEGTEVPWNCSPCRHALDEGRVQCDDVPDRWPESAAAWTTGLRTYVGVPVRRVDGTLFGTLCAASAQRHVVDADGEQAMWLFSRLVAERVEREALVEQVRRARAELAGSPLSDPLTGLPNRRSLVAELARMLARAQRDDRALVVGVVDIGDDGRNPATADRLRRAVARALEDTLRAGDLVARIDRDVFAVAATLPRESGDASAAVLQERLATALRGTLDLGDGRVTDGTAARIGVDLARTGEIDADALLDRVEHAMRASTTTARGPR